MPETFEKMKSFAENLKGFLTRNNEREDVFTIDAIPDMFQTAPDPKFNTSGIIRITKIKETNGLALLTIPLKEKAILYKIIPFAKDNAVFKYSHFVDSPFGKYVTNNLTGKGKNFECAISLFEKTIAENCMKALEPSTLQSNVINCKRIGPSLVVTSGKPFEATLVCHSNNFFNFTIKQGTTFLKPCILKTKNAVLNDILGPVANTITNPFQKIELTKISRTFAFDTKDIIALSSIGFGV